MLINSSIIKVWISWYSELCWRNFCTSVNSGASIETSKSKCLSFSNWCVKSTIEGWSPSNGLFTDQVKFLKMFDFCSLIQNSKCCSNYPSGWNPGKLRFFLNFSWFCFVKMLFDGSFSNFLYFGRDSTILEIRDFDEFLTQNYAVFFSFDQK